MRESKRASIAALITAFTFATDVLWTPLAAAHVQGGGSPKSDCYVEFDVQGVDGSSKITCTEGDPCDTGPCGDQKCSFKIALCVNQTDIPQCTPKPFKKPPKVSGNLLTVGTTTGSAAGCFTASTVDVALKRNGKKKGKKKIVVTAKVNGKPKGEKDSLKLTCIPRTGPCPPTTTTTATSTTSTTVPPPENSLAFTTTVGTTDCGGAGLLTVAAAPFSGELDSDTACTTKLSTCGSGSSSCDLGRGCLYFGGGAATLVPPGRIPDAATTFLDVASPNTLAASAGTGANDCSKGTGPARHCVNQDARPACTADLDCGGAAGSCALDANCYFGPPLPILSPPPNGALTTCVLNVVETDASGTFDGATGAARVSLPLTSRVYITGNTSSPCPKCVSGTCSYGLKSGMPCTGVGSIGTTNDCPPTFTGKFQAPLPVDLTPLTTGTASMTSGTGVFCPGQNNAGAYGQPGVRCIQETGTPAGDLSDGNQHASVLAAVFCIPATGSAAVDGVADLPGPGSIGLNGVSQLRQQVTTTTGAPTTTTTAAPTTTTTVTTTSSTTTTT